MSSAPTPLAPLPARPPHQPTRLGAWLQRRSGRLVAHVLLLLLGSLNIYPFLWMVSTSLKTDEEVQSAKASIGIHRKYELAASAPADEAGLSPRQAGLLATLRTENAKLREVARTFIPYRIDARAYAGQFQIWRDEGGVRSYDIPTAEAELEQLVSSGYMDSVRFQIENYAYVFNDLNFALHTVVSLVVVAAVVLITVLMSAMLGYALVRLRFPGKLLVFGLLLAGTVAPRDANYVPIFLMFQSLGLFDSLWAMVLWMSGISIGNAFLMAGFFLTLPGEVEEAAKVDGAGPFRIFFTVMLPMAKPIVMTVALFSFLGAWNEFMVPYLCTLSSPELQPLAVAVYTFRQQAPELWHLTNAAAAIMVIPVIAIFIFMQRSIVDSIAVGAVKG